MIDPIGDVLRRLRAKHRKGVQSEVSFLVATEKALQLAIVRKDWDLVRQTADTITELADNLSDLSREAS